MNTPTAQVKLTLPINLVEFLQSKSQRLGLPLASFIRHVLIKEVEEEEYPIFQASKKDELAYKKALQEYKSGKLKFTDNLDELFKPF